jgi:diaminohydroxyphosphoribosylaminopyrimidine deaminase/5-amino-6-(5-phosphoribosylamino)uracil reductase
MSHDLFIKKTFELARRGLGTTWPNPMVGAVIVKNGKVIGEGFHAQKGFAHAELDALNNCTESPEGSTIYVNLEPCCHTNKTTPPCAQRLIKEKIRKVVICNLDPNPAVFGQGVKLLEDNGIEVEHGILSDEGEKLNEVFFHAQRNNRPFIHYKTAITLDGKTAMKNGESQWITGEMARAHVHELRTLHQGIIVGGETVRVDNPRLTVRTPYYSGKQPVRIVFTKSGNLPATHHLFTDEFHHTTLIYTENKLSFDFPSSQVIKIKNLNEAMTDLFSKNLINLMMESGSCLAADFMKEGFIDRVSIYQNPSFLGEGRGMLKNLGIKNLNERPRLTEMESSWLGEDLYLSGRLKG